MNILLFLEKLAENAHYSGNINMLISQQPDEIKKILIENDSEKLKKQIGDTKCLANWTNIVQL